MEAEIRIIDQLAEEGNRLFDEGKFKEAAEVYQHALAMIEEPHNASADAFWFQVSLGDAYFMDMEYEKAYRWLFEAKSNIGGDGYVNPFVMMRLGECARETGRHQEADEYLLRAYMLAGEEVFEEDDRKYLEGIRHLTG